MLQRPALFALRLLPLLLPTGAESQRGGPVRDERRNEFDALLRRLDLRSE